ncbi:hypothetical protein F3087_24345 [Nocardia colli]|uniref:Uncharacterized protein n=1 Tax=Nocardia colli TaxID=2545717 RepID=A0A5N0EC47_9NOCA|nr:hypothetical protein [Nocardia colli]KAA8886370.1 hypothetical protein F3087_24345 [Nocardia colli]
MTKLRFAAAIAGISAGISLLGLPAQASADTPVRGPAIAVAQQVPGSFDVAEMYCAPGQDGKIVWIQDGFYECKHVGDYKFVWVPRPDRGPQG